MKQAIIISICIVAVVSIVRCTKNNSTPAKNLATCTTCTYVPIEHTPDSTGLYYYLPTAFTPNGDGINDMLRLFYSSEVNVDSSTLTIWDMNGNGVFTGTINQSWNGYDLKGNLCAAGHYPLYLKLRLLSGATVATCGCVTILTYKGNCIYTGGVTYYYGDELDSAGFVNPTSDHICP